MAKKGESNDRLSIWPTAMACCLPLVLIILWSGPFDLAVFGTAVLLMSWACSALLALAMAIFSALSHHWWRAVSMSVLPFVTLVVIVNASSFWSFGKRDFPRTLMPAVLTDGLFSIWLVRQWRLCGS